MKLSYLTVLLTGALFLVGCNTEAIPDIAERSEAPAAESLGDGYGEAEGVLANENLDLLAVGNLLNDASDPAEFERLLNKNDGINNLDLNGDGYVDYISVQEFEDRDDGQRGFSLFSRFGPNEIQEIASIILGRDRPDQRGARLYISGNEQIYGNNYGYEGNWLDKSLSIANWAFGNRDQQYSSPYYYDNYPDYYREYRVIDTPLYQERITKYQVNPAMTKITTPTMKIKIKSPYPGRSYRRAFAKMKKPTEEQIVFYKNRRDQPEFRKEKNGTYGSDKDWKDKGNEGRGSDFEKGPKDDGKRNAGKRSDNEGHKNNGKQPGQKDNNKDNGKSDKGPKGDGGGQGKGKGGKPVKN